MGLRILKQIIHFLLHLLHLLLEGILLILLLALLIGLLIILLGLFLGRGLLLVLLVLLLPACLFFPAPGSQKPVDLAVTVTVYEDSNQNGQQMHSIMQLQQWMRALMAANHNHKAVIATMVMTWVQSAELPQVSVAR